MEKRLDSLLPLIEKLFQLSGSPGLSLGVLHNGTTVFNGNFGRIRASAAAAPTDDTLYNVASITKLMTVGVVVNLISEGLLEWDVPIRHYLPEFGERLDDVGQKATITDLLANRTGLSAQNTFWGVMNEDIFQNRTEIPRVACHLPAYGEFRKTFVYSSWGYGLVTSAIERVTGKPFSACVEKYVFGPLGMKRSTTNIPKVDNVVYKHWVDTEGVAHEFPWSESRGWSDDTGFGGTAGARSSTKELLAATFTGYSGSMVLDPRSQSAIVILVNSLPLFDIADFLGQLLLGTLLGEEVKTDYVQLAESIIGTNKRLYDFYKFELDKKRSDKKTTFPLKKYEGEYWNEGGMICYSVKAQGDAQLLVTIKGSMLSTYKLELWGGDLFCFVPDRLWEVSHSMFPFSSTKSRLFQFNCNDQGVLSFTWHHDPTTGSKPETFIRKTAVHPKL
ncbi:beta-lactamase/transpeptidase-like protein [Periconia macrospinosa]|uniref:Beta-lactamase/transpeptidase-like protein n=1 Tax=Periconia macrospinosa TaxID=97972 RepID=A0A2V1DJ16_9PLEO|nr:beta-lactamase/transpeptidase-like protein [Periconia macrospinosa]